MSFVVVDTDVVSFLFKDDDIRAERYRPHLENKMAVVSFMTVAELYRWMLIRNWGATRRTALEERLRKFTKHPYSDGLCRTWANVSYSARRNGRPIETADAWVAAVAIFRNVPLITHNADDYKGVDGLTIINEPDR